MTRSPGDDFARLPGVNDGSFVTLTYTFDDIVKALNTVQPYDWASFLRSRLDGGHSPGAPLDGIATRGGYKLALHGDSHRLPSRNSETRRKVTDLTYSLGMIRAADGHLTDVLWEGPAYKSGLTVTTQIIAVNGAAYDPDRLKSTISDAKQSGAAIELLVKNGDRFSTSENRLP